MNKNIPLNISPKELNKILEDDSSEKPFIVDVREDNEIAICLIFILSITSTFE